MMKVANKKIVSLLLAFALMVQTIGFVPIYAEQMGDSPLTFVSENISSEGDENGDGGLLENILENKQQAIPNEDGVSDNLPSDDTTSEDQLLDENKAENSNDIQDESEELNENNDENQEDLNKDPQEVETNDLLAHGSLETEVWTTEDFTYQEGNYGIITGFSEAGLEKLAINKDLSIPETGPDETPITEIAANAFKGKELVSVDFPDTITSIGNSAFNTNQIGGELRLPESLTSMGMQVFMKNEITKVSIPDEVTIIGAGAFNTNKLREVYIHGKISQINGAAFAKNQIETITFEENKGNFEEGEGISILAGAFQENQIRESILPYNVKGISFNVFNKNTIEDETKTVLLKTKNPAHIYDSDITDISKNGMSTFELSLVEEVPERYWLAEDFTYSKDSSTTITGFSETGIAKLIENKELEIPLQNKNGEVIKRIDSYAFAKQGLTKVVFPEGIDGFEIQSSAFINNHIEELVLPEGIYTIEANAFQNNRLSSVHLPQSVLRIGNSAFRNNVISDLQFADTKEKIQINGFAFDNNQIKEVNLPYVIEMLSRTTFSNNTGMETSSVEGSGIVYMYTKNPVHFNQDRIVHIDGVNSVPYQKLILSDSSVTNVWEQADFTYEGQSITGLSEQGQKKAEATKILILPDLNSQGQAVIEIANGAFQMESEVSGNEVISPNGFTNIIFPKNLQIIGDKAFLYNNFTELDLPHTVEHIGMQAFNGNKITHLSLPKNLTSMGEGAFGVNKLTSLEINSKLKTIPAGAFTANTTLTHLNIPEGVIEIGASAFRGAQLKTLNISSTVEMIGDSAFILHRLETLTIPGNVKSIGKNAFEGNSNAKTLKALYLNEGIEEIAQSAFSKNLLERIEFPSSVSKLHEKSFTNNPGVVKVYTTNSLHQDFEANASSHEIIYFDQNDLWAAEDFTYDGTILTGFSSSGRSKAIEYRLVVLPDTNPEGQVITKIGKEAFVPEGYGFDREDVVSPNGFTKLVLPNNLEIIEEKAFQFNNLTTIDFPETLHTIGLQAFNGNQLQKLSLPETLVNIGEGAFSTNKLTDVTLPRNMKKIPNGIFARNITLQQIEIPNGVEVIGEFAFNGAQLKSLNLPNSVIEIKRGAFYYHQIRELTIPSSVKVLGDSAFAGTPKAIRLEKLTLNEGIKEIGPRAFAIGLLKEVTLPDSVEKLAVNAFADNTGYQVSGKVNVYTSNEKHLDFSKSETYTIIFTAPEQEEEEKPNDSVEEEKPEDSTEEEKPSGGQENTGNSGSQSSVRPENHGTVPKSVESIESKQPLSDNKVDISNPVMVKTIISIGGNTTTIIENGISRQITMDVAPMIQEGRTMMPARFVADVLGVGIDFNSQSKTATFLYNDARVSLAVGQKFMIVNGIKVELQTMPKVINGRILLPLRDIQEAFKGLGMNATIDWNKDTKEVIIAKH